MKKPLLRLLVLVALSAFVLPVVGRAQDPALKQRMEQRLASVDALKARKVAGENNRGYLEIRAAANAAEKQLVDAENRDREAVYDAIARQSGTTREVVGRARAGAIAARSAPGLLIQAADGTWSEKK